MHLGSSSQAGEGLRWKSYLEQFQRATWTVAGEPLPKWAIWTSTLSQNARCDARATAAPSCFLKCDMIDFVRSDRLVHRTAKPSERSSLGFVRRSIRPPSPRGERPSPQPAPTIAALSCP